MSGNGEKIMTKFCPFQTQIGGPVKMGGHEQMLLGSQGIPIIKVACDKEKCQLWDRSTLECSVSYIGPSLYHISRVMDNIESAIRDLEL